MAQHDYDIANASFPTVRTDINNVLSAINSTNSGSSRPSSAVAGTIWLDTSGAATAQLLKMYDGAADILLGTVNFTANTIDWSDSAITLGANSVDSDNYVDGSIDTEHIADNQITLAKMASGTDGNIISYDASGNPVAVATGSSGQVLTSAGAGAVPSFQAVAAGGKIGQVISTAKVDHFSTSSSSFTDITGLSVAITPSASNSKIYVMTNFMGGSDSGSGYPSFRMLRGSTVINAGTTAGGRVGGFLHMNIYNADADSGMSISTAFLDSPNTTSATTYKIQAKQSGGNILRVGAGGNDNDNAAYIRSASVITVMEVLA